jgi:5-methylcytosine-specific restriction endonuclease McrA
MDVSRRVVKAVNGAFQSIGNISIERAICLLLADKAYSVKDTGNVIRSTKFQVTVPEIIVVPTAKYIKQSRKPWNKKDMYERDNYACVYCGSSIRGLLTTDHVIPRTRWKTVSKERGVTYELNSFENCVTACLLCNQKKGSKLLSELGWSEITGTHPDDSIQIDWDAIFN